MNSDVSTALLASLAAQANRPERTEGVRVRRACGFSPMAPFVAEVTQLTPVGVVTVVGHGDTAEQAVDAARAQVAPSVIDIAPPDVRERLREPIKPEDMKKLMGALKEALGIGGDDGEPDILFDEESGLIGIPLPAPQKALPPGPEDDDVDI